MSKKMWHKIFKSSKSSAKNPKLAAAHNKAAKKRCSIYEEYQQLQAVEEQQKQKRQQQQTKQQQECETPLNLVATCAAAAAERALPTTSSKKTSATTLAGVSEPLISSINSDSSSHKSHNGNSGSHNGNAKPTQSAFAKVVNSFTLRRSAATQQQRDKAAAAGNGNGNSSHSHNQSSDSKTTKNNSNIIESTAEQYPDAPADLAACPTCQRTFNPRALLKHVGICQKMATKKRNVFDSSRQRREGTELASYPVPKDYGLPPIKQERSQSPKTTHIASPILTRKKSSDELTRSTARASMRKMSTSSTKSAVNAPTANTSVAIASNTSLVSSSGVGGGNFSRDRMRSSDRAIGKRIQAQPSSEQCPHCDRCFGIKAYDRHVEWCKEKALQASIKQGSRTEQNLAKERLEARIKYRAPCLKTKRSINRDKYAGLAGDENDLADHQKTEYNNNSNTTSNSIMSLSMTSSVTSDRNNTNLGNHLNNQPRDTRTGHEYNSYRIEQTPNSTLSAQTSELIETAYNSIKNFRLMGAQLSTADGNARKKKKPKSKDPSIEEESQPTYNEGIKAADDTRNKRREESFPISKSVTFSTPSGMPEPEQTSPPASASNSCSNIATNNAGIGNKRRPPFRSSQKPSTSLHLSPAQAVIASASHDANEMHSSLSLPLLEKPSLLPIRQQRQATPPPQVPPTDKQRFSLLDAPPNRNSAPPPKPNRRSLDTTLNRNVEDLSPPKIDIKQIKSVTICRPKRKKLIRQSSPLRPLKPIPLLKESIEMLVNPPKAMSNISSNVTSTTANKDEDYQDMDDCNDIKVIKAPPSLLRNKSFIVSGLPTDKYDPFVSAKRQLEELCSASPPMSASPDRSKTHPPNPPLVSGLPAKMTTSLTLCTSPSTSPLTTNSQNRSTPVTTKGSNFRRTSSLRGPRRSPMLPSRPLFAQNHRPTIQRGLSDEGPISTNFLKPEEYDEMPVRSVCVNDYAITNSPRLARRDNSLWNRKQSLKLNVQGGTTTTGPTTTPTLTPTPTTNTALVNSKDAPLEPTARNLSKTDSLAVFLKYENELTKLQGPNADSGANSNSATITNGTVEHSPLNTPILAQNMAHSPVTTKELKDKSNTLSKQNSAKSIKAECVEAPKEQSTTLSLDHREKLPTVERIPNVATQADTAPAHKINLLRLEPISLPQAASTPIIKGNKTSTNVLATSTTTQLPTVANQSVNLNALFGDTKSDVGARLPLPGKDRKHPSSSEFIDPKLINQCDNLPVNLSTVRALKSNASFETVERRPEVYTTASTPSSESSTTTQTGPISQLTKLLPLKKAENGLMKPSSASSAADDAINPLCLTTTATASASYQMQQHSPHPTVSQRNSAESRNLLKRKMRLGRNQFLYDASPEADDSCSADDEANRSTVESDKDHSQQPLSPIQPQHAQTTQLKTPPIIPSIPIFDDFDFEEFLSSFEHDDEQFPLFKDCREFLLNRTSSKQRSTIKPSSTFDTNTNTNKNNNTSINQSSKINNFATNTHPHCQFPSLSTHPTLFLTSSSLRSPESPALPSSPNAMGNESSPLPSNRSNDSYNADLLMSRRSADQADQKKGEIFISIETEQNEHGRLPISPESLRNFVGNPQAIVEVVDATDNKFSKISDDEPLPPASNSQQHRQQMSFAGGLPNVQLNNAKNLIQKMQGDFRQMSEEVSANFRQSMQSYGNNMHSPFGEEGGAARYTMPMDDTGVDADSDDMSSIDGYPISGKSSLHGVSSKLSADSAYGSLSRQRSSELSMQRSLGRSRPSTSNCSANSPLPTTIKHDAIAPQRHLLPEMKTLPPKSVTYKYQTGKGRAQQYSGSSSSDNSEEPPFKNGGGGGSGSGSGSNTNYKFQKPQQQLYNNNNYESPSVQRRGSHSKHRHQSSSNNNNNNSQNCLISPNSSPVPSFLKSNEMTMPAAANNDNNANANVCSSSSTSMTNSNPAMSTSAKMSKYCHECGSKFIVEQAKFCMDCGVRRLVL